MLSIRNFRKHFFDTHFLYLFLGFYLFADISIASNTTCYYPDGLESKRSPCDPTPMYPHAVGLVLSVWATVSALPGQMTEKLTTINSTEAVVLIQRGSHQHVQTFVLVVGAAILFSQTTRFMDRNI